MIIYHEVKSDDVPKILEEGIKCGGSGAKSDGTIQKTDDLLDGRIPDELADKHVSRSDNLYGYVTTEGKIIDITDGRHVDIAQFIKNSEMAVLRVGVMPASCFVSDLDAYDAVKQAVENNASDEELDMLADEYWRKIVPLDQFELGSVKRPEVMITYDVEPSKLSVVST